LLPAGGEKTRDSRGDFGRTEHAGLDAGGRQVGAEVVERTAQQRGVDRLDLRDAERGLHRERGDGGQAEEAVRGKGLDVRSDSGTG
jgi:hypothetical protein